MPTDFTNARTLGSPAPGDYDPYYAQYVDRVAGHDVMALLEAGPSATSAALANLTDAAAAMSPAPGEWSVKEVISHLCDFERVFAYRAMNFSRRSGIALPTYDQDRFVAHSNANARPLSELLAEFATLRKATLFLYQGMTTEMTGLRGMASSAVMSVRAVAFVIAGHEIGHREDLARIHAPAG